MTPPIPDAVLWLLVLALVAAGIAASRYRKAAATRARHVKDLKEAIGERDRTIQVYDLAIRLRDEEARHLADHRVPVLVNGLWQGRHTEAPGLLHYQELADTPFARAQESVLAMFAGVAAQAAERAEGAAQAAVKTVTRSMQGLLNEQASAVLEMLQRHHDEEVLQDANAIDHASSQLARRAQVIGILTGSWPGRQRVNSPLLDVVRGGESRIRDYHRVKITGEPALSLVSRAVEPVVLAIAELLDNAARHSEPGSDVRVWFVGAFNGVSIVIDDSGVGLKPEDRMLAARLLSGQEPVRLTQLRNPPKLGFAAVGVLAARYGFRASVDQESDFGGVRAIVYLPNALLTASTEPSPAVSQPQPAAVGVPMPPAELAPHSEQYLPEAGQPFDERPDGLPQRRRQGPRRHAAPAQPAMQTPTNSGSSIGAFVRGSQTARQQNPDERNS